MGSRESLRFDHGQILEISLDWQAVHGFMSNLWLRTAGAVLICSIPVIIFVYARYWQPEPKTTEVTQTASPVPGTPSPEPAAPSADIEAAQSTTPLPEQEAPNFAQGSDALRPVARLATLFSVVIMGIAGAFVSNYSRVCALLREGTPLSVSSADRSIRVRFSPFIGGLLAVALSEVFGGHLV